MTARRGRHPERGSAAPMVAYATVLLTFMGLGGATIGRMVHAKKEAQNAADAAAMAAADTLREDGINGNRSGAVGIGIRNGTSPTEVFDDGATEEGLELTVRTHATQPIDTPRLIFQTDGVLRAKAKASIGQEVRELIGPGTGDLVLVLDYSGSMKGPPIATLEEALTEHLLHSTSQLQYAAALFSTNLVAEVPFGPDARGKIVEKFVKHDVVEGTRPEFGFDKARDFLKNRTGDWRYVMFVSDGEPNVLPDAVAASKRLWDEAGATVLTIHLGKSGIESQFMIQVSGPPNDRGNKRYYHLVTNLEEFREALAAVVAEISCPLAPLTKAKVRKPVVVRGFLADANGNEVKIQHFDNLQEHKAELGFHYDDYTGSLALTDTACSHMRQSGDRLVLRYNRGTLVDER